MADGSTKENVSLSIRVRFSLGTSGYGANKAEGSLPRFGREIGGEGEENLAGFSPSFKKRGSPAWKPWRRRVNETLRIYAVVFEDKR